MVSIMHLLSYLQETHVIPACPRTYSVKQGHGSDVVHEISPIRLKSFSFHIKHEKCDVIRDCVMCSVSLVADRVVYRKCPPPHTHTHRADFTQNSAKKTKTPSE